MAVNVALRTANQPSMYPYQPDYGIASFADFKIPQFNTTLPSINTNFKIDPSLDVGALLGGFTNASKIASQPLGQVAESLIAPQLPFIRKDVNQLLTQQQSKATAEGVRRNIAGSSTVNQKVNVDLPNEAADLLARTEADLVAKTLPLALGQQQFQAGLETSKSQFELNLRNVISGEEFNKLNIQQRQSLAEADLNLKKELAVIEHNFQAQELIASQKFTATQNEIDRMEAAKQLEYIKQQRLKAKEGAMFKGLLTLAGFGVGFGAGGPVGAYLGSIAGSSAGDIFNGF